MCLIKYIVHVYHRLKVHYLELNEQYVWIPTKC